MPRVRIRPQPWWVIAFATLAIAPHALISGNRLLIGHVNGESTGHLFIQRLIRNAIASGESPLVLTFPGLDEATLYPNDVLVRLPAALLGGLIGDVAACNLLAIAQVALLGWATMALARELGIGRWPAALAGLFMVLDPCFLGFLACGRLDSTTIGWAIFLQEYLRLIQGTRERWLQPIYTEPHLLGAAQGFAVSVATSQILVLLLTAGLCAALWLGMARSRFGRHHRACSDDGAMAALCGVDVDRTVALSFALGAAYAAAGGFLVILYYGGVNFYMGLLLGFKALVAAIVGGIGSVPGAMLGGVLVAVLETFWSGYLTIAYKDVAVFGLLAAMLVFRPCGLLGKPSSRGD